MDDRGQPLVRSQGEAVDVDGVVPVVERGDDRASLAGERVGVGAGVVVGFVAIGWWERAGEGT
jgi:hypothetical protein